MPIRVQDADGTTIEFPDGTPQDTIVGVMRRRDQEREARGRQPPSAEEAPGSVLGAMVGSTPTPNDAQRQEARRLAWQRQLVRSGANAGIGALTQPLVNMATDPARRENVVSSARGLMRDVRELPNVDWGRVGRETAESVQQGMRDLPRTLGNVASNLPQIARAITYGPFVDEERAQQDLDMARIMGNEAGVDAAAGRANTQTANAALNVAAPFAVGRAPTVLRAAGTAAALDAPFALSRNSNQPLQERLPGALAEMGGVAAFGGGAQALANTGPAISRMLPSRGAGMVRRMDRAGASVDAHGNPVQPRGVAPSLATANGGVGVSGPATKLVGDNIIGGVMVRPRVRRALTQTRDAVHDVRDAYGRARSTEGANAVISEGVERFASDAGRAAPAGVPPLRLSTRDMGFATKARLVFDHALRPIEGNPAQLANTQAALAQLLRRADSPVVRAFNADPVLSRFRSTVTTLGRRAQNGAPPTLRDLRELRRGVREAQGRVRLGPDTVDNAALRQIEAALSDDIYAAAGGAADQLRAADRFYARGRRRIDGLQQVASVSDILRAAAPRTANTRLLAALRSALPDDEWRVVAASIIDEMSRPTKGASGFVAQQDFSVSQFASAYRNMTPGARRIIFGSRGGQGGRAGATMRQLADDLDNLAEVALAQKGVENSANFSGSGRDAQNFATFGLSISNLPVATGTVMGLMLTGEMLTNPGFVRWLVSAQRRGGGPAGMRRNLAALRDLASRDPALWPAVEALEAQLQDQQYTPAPGAGDGRADTPRQRELATQ